MERSLSVLLPVRNVESTLASIVHQLLDVVPELTGDFELVIVDDGSIDATIEVADDLAMQYPQVRVLRHGRPMGRGAAIQTGLEHSRGEVIFLQDDGCTLAIDELPQLWRALDRHDFALGRPNTIPGPKWNRWRESSPSVLAGFQMAYRRAIQPLQESLTDQASLRQRLSSLGYRWHEVPLRDRGIPRGKSSAGPRAPNYLTRLKDFALGE